MKIRSAATSAAKNPLFLDGCNKGRNLAFSLIFLKPLSAPSCIIYPAKLGGEDYFGELHRMGIATASKPTIPNRQAKMYAIAFLASSILTSAAPGQLIRVNVIKNSSIVGPVSFGGMRHVGFVPYGYQPVSAGFAHGGAHLVGSHSLVFPVAGSSMSYLPTAAGGTVADSSLSVMGLLNLFDLLDKIASRAPAPRAPISDAKLSDFESRLKSFDEKLSALEKRIDKISEKVELLVKLTEQHDELLKKSPGAGVPKLPTPNP